MFKVMVACETHCEHWEDVRETLRTESAIEAIRESEIHRDQDHTSWVEEIKSETPSKLKYNMTASRDHSGIEGDFTSLKEVLYRLDMYDKSFPGEVNEVCISKIGH